MAGDDRDIESEAYDALEDFQERVERAQSKSTPKQIKAEQEAVNEVIDTLANLYIDGLDAPDGVFAEAISEFSRMNKTEAKEQIVRRIKEKESMFGQPLEEWVSENIEKIRETKTTDHIQDTSYTWEFGGAITVETASGDGRRGHLEWPNFREMIYEAGGPGLDQPSPNYNGREEWRDFILGLEDADEVDYEKQTSKGPRTRAVEYLKDRVQFAEGYGQLEDAVDMRGCYVEVHNDPPADKQPVDTDDPSQECPLWRVELVMVPNEWPKNAADEFDVTTRALQNELDSRGHTVDGARTVSKTEWINGVRHSFWVLDGDFAAPSGYIPELSEVEKEEAEHGPAAEMNEGHGGERDRGAVGGDS